MVISLRYAVSFADVTMNHSGQDMKWQIKVL